jgi:hypothetical protein
MDLAPAVQVVVDIGVLCRANCQEETHPLSLYLQLQPVQLTQLL